MQLHGKTANFSIKLLRNKLRPRPEKEERKVTNKASLKEQTSVSKAHGGSHLLVPLQAPSHKTLKRYSNTKIK